MSASLRGRLQLVMTLVLALTVAAVGLAFAKVSVHELTRLSAAGAHDLGAVARALEARFAAAPHGALADAVAQLGKEHETGLILIREGRVLAATPEVFSAARVERKPDGSLVLHARRGAEEITLAFRGAGIPVHLADGDASLYTAPATSPGALRPLQRAIVLVVVVAGLAGALLVHALARRLTGPLEALNDAVRRLEEGDPSVRVPVTGVDEIGRLASSFNALARKTETSERLRREMVSDVAHELRAPLTNLRGELESIQDGVRPLDTARVDSLYAEVLALSALVDDLQDLALADAGQMTLEKAPVDLHAVAGRVVSASRAAAEAAGVALAVADGPAVPAEGDDRRLVQVLRNFVQNALAHTPRGGRVTVRASRSGSRARVAVEDTGDGIAPDELLFVFERFYRTDKSRVRTTGGAGLGLAIAKKIVEAHGGGIGAESVRGTGSAFWFEIPAAP